MATSTSSLERSIDRIRDTCEMMGSGDKFQRTIAELEAYLEEEMAAGKPAKRASHSTGSAFFTDYSRSSDEHLVSRQKLRRTSGRALDVDMS
jgi:hypothetical protein